MRVVHFLHGRANPNGTNGGDRVIHNLAKHMAELGAQVFVFGLSDKSPLTNGRAVVQNFCPPRDPFSLPSPLKSRLLGIKPEVVHFHGVYTARNATLAQWLRREDIRYAISPHGGLMEEVLSRGRMRKVTYLALLGRTFCRGASLIHCVSQAEADAVRPFSGDVPAVVAPHGLEGMDLESLDPGALRREHPKLRGKRIFGFLGRLDPAHKGLDLVAEACARIRSSLSNAVVILAGPDWKDRTLALRAKVRELGLQDTVLFVGPKMGQDKFNFLASCDVFIHPSRWEAGVPFSVLDALELAKPCLVSSGSFFGDFFQRHAVGKQVPATTAGVAAGLRYFAEASTDLLQAMGVAGREAVLREFSWERSAQKLLQAYDLRHGFLSRREGHGDAPALA
ncbi:MAG: glycosyltransferase family 4 protein [Candidatus Sulfotelmatobacter sp.]